MPSKKDPFGQVPKMKGLPKLKGLGNTSSGHERTPEDPNLIQSSPDYQKIVEAIDRASVLSARYQDETEAREFIPTRIGTLRGSYSVEAFQVGGYSSSGLKAGGEWRNLVLVGLKDIHAVDRIAYVGSRESRKNRNFDSVVYPPE